MTTITTPQVDVTRTFDAPRTLVFKAWTDPKRIAQWWGPHGFTNPVCKADARPGGAIHIDMKAPDGVVYPMKGEFREVVEPERIVFVAWALDKDGKALFETLNTVTLSEQGGKTTQRVTARVMNAGPDAAPYLQGMQEGWSQSLERLQGFLAKK